MIADITLHFGALTGDRPLVFRPPHITVFVGPNNAGKSLALRELYATLRESPDSGFRKIVDKITTIPMDQAAVLALVARRTSHSNPTSVTLKGRDQQTWELQRNGDDIVQRELPHFLHRILGYYVLVLDGEARLKLSGAQAFKGFHISEPQHHWATLFKDAAARAKLSTDIHAAFHRHLALDVVTSVGYVIPRLSDNPVPTHLEQSLTAEAAEFFSGATELTAFSDGVKAYCGMLAVLRGGDDRLILIDEPDAFLHPPLARHLGQQIARLAAEREAQVFAATHSTHFIFGAISSGVHVSIVRLTYDGSAATARVLDQSRLSELMRDPLIRATGVLEALFHQSVIVCEGHSDRVLYDEVNARLVNVARGIKDCLFLNAGSWQNVRKLVSPLRQLGIAVAVIVDLDVIQKSDFTELMKAMGIPDATAHGIRQQAGDISRAVADAGQTLKKGLQETSVSSRRALNDLLRTVAGHGLFLVPVGELEGWLASLNVTVNKTEWVAHILDRLATGALVQPGNDDVWAFMDNISAWLKSA